MRCHSSAPCVSAGPASSVHIGTKQYQNDVEIESQLPVPSDGALRARRVERIGNGGCAARKWLARARGRASLTVWTLLGAQHVDDWTTAAKDSKEGLTNHAIMQ